MSTRFMRLAAVVFIAGAIGAFATRSLASAPPAIAAVAAAAEPHPNIQAAIAALEAAKLDLQRANHDFGGHRREALNAVNGALKQLHLALEYDK